MANLRLVRSNDGPTDRELIDRTIAGDDAAYAALVERYQRKIFRLAWSIVRDELEAESITQDAFVQAYVNLAKFEHRAQFETWLTRIAVNRCRDTLRSRRFISLSSVIADDETGSPLLEIADGRPDAERQVMSKQIRQALRRAMSALSAQQKLIFRLRHHDDLSLEEIASLLGLRSGTVRAHLFRAVQKIRKELGAFKAAADEESPE